MCTVTIIATCKSGADESLVRVVCNRDEQRKRPPALPPVVRKLGERAVVMPVDPQSGGTWIGANDAGLMAILLNVHRANGEARRPVVQSRGTIIPRVLHCESVDQAVEDARQIDISALADFCLVLLDARHIAELRGDGTGMISTLASFDHRPLFYTSSGLGDDLVEKPRRRLFEQTFHEPEDLIEKQERFHAHFWPDRTHLSVLMSRPDACTVSRTVVEMDPGSIRMTYIDTASAVPEVFPPVHLDRRAATP